MTAPTFSPPLSPQRAHVRRPRAARPRAAAPVRHAAPSDRHVADAYPVHIDAPVTGVAGGVIAAWNVRAHALRVARRVGALVACDVAAVAAVHAGAASFGVHAARAWAPLAAATMIALIAGQCYDGGNWRRNVRGLLVAALVASGVLVWPALWVTPVTAALDALWLAAALAGALWAGRAAADRVHRALVERGALQLPTGRVLLVGPAGACAARQADTSWAREQALTYVGALHTDTTPIEGPDGIAEVLTSIVNASHADTVLLVGGVSDAELSSVLGAATMLGCEVLAPSRAYESSGARPEVRWRHGTAFIALRPVGLRASQLAFKRALDLAIALPLLVLTAPLLAVLAAAVRLTSDGPAVFAQPRLGRHGRRFRCYKFRSMYRDAEARLHRDPELHAAYVRADYKLPQDEDPRITPLGRFLRRTSLDELPQLWNVVRGQMSLVGPRPIVPAEIGHYEEHGLRLLALKPGVTGLWQVSGRSAMAYPQRTHVELEYVDRWCVGLDLTILARTIPAVLAQHGAH
ncbi:hypothetical protein tb265_41920 [Gemmatimonadetes bacterium T265]|nr:hypothetical protein tb265_41920 [Gemmatimonadetes bacterium T265]